MPSERQSGCALGYLSGSENSRDSGRSASVTQCLLREPQTSGFCLCSRHVDREVCFLLWIDPCGHGCVLMEINIFELLHSLFLHYTYANYMTCRFLSVIIYIHIHEPCCLPLAIWPLLNLICIILKTESLVSQHGKE